MIIGNTIVSAVHKMSYDRILGELSMICDALSSLVDVLGSATRLHRQQHGIMCL
jgi:hypothetical protein